MQRETETRWAEAAPRRRAVKKLRPGLWPAAAMAVASGTLCWVWLTSQQTSARGSDRGQTIVSRLSEVSEQDVPAALTTMVGSRAFLARFKQRGSGCPLPLAWVSIAARAGQPAGMIRVGSGPYMSPDFHLLPTPVRIAIPYPGPYESGHGKLVILDAGGGATIALSPPVQVSAKNTPATRSVSWHPAKHCTQPDG